jgi:hypothetical protein
MVVPMKSQYEQLCNATSLKQLGVPVIKNLKNKKLLKIGLWLESDEHIQIDYPDITASVIEMMMEHYFSKNPQPSLSRISIYRSMNQLMNFHRNL